MAQNGGRGVVKHAATAIVAVAAIVGNRTVANDERTAPVKILYTTA